MHLDMRGKMEDIELQEHLIEIDLVKNHLREASNLLNQMAMRGARRMDMKDPDKFNQFMNNQAVNRKARDCIALALFTLKQEIIELFWKKEMEDELIKS